MALFGLGWGFLGFLVFTFTGSPSCGENSIYTSTMATKQRQLSGLGMLLGGGANQPTSSTTTSSSAKSVPASASAAAAESKQLDGSLNGLANLEVLQRNIPVSRASVYQSKRVNLML